MAGRLQADASNQKAVALARRVATGLSEQDRVHLHHWAVDLLQIRNSNLSVLNKARAALRATLNSDVARLFVAQFTRQARDLGINAKRLLWDERGWPARLGLLGATATVTTFGGQGAGIVALGGGIGVPLWLVVGAGGTVLGALVEELAPTRPDAKATVIEVTKVDSVHTKRLP